MESLILNRYKPIEQAGKGGFGTVVVAWDTRMRRKVAIKIITLDQRILDEKTKTMTQMLNSDDMKKTQILPNNNKNISKGAKSIDEAGEHWQDNVPGLVEARTAAMIQDPNIVTVYDFELEANNAYIIMEYVEGMTLTQFLEKHNDDMTLDMLTCIFQGVSHALELAHASNVLHLDIKPDNILIDLKGKVKVTDFGLATLADEFGYGTVSAGTIGYMPPEQMRQQALDVRSDEWALACLTYEMLCGKNPFDAPDIQSALNKAEDIKLSLPSACWEDVNTDLDDVMFMALSPDPNDRFSSVSEFSEAMSKNLANARSGQKQLSALFKNDIEGEQDNQDQDDKSSIIEKLTNNLWLKIFGRLFAVIAVCPLTILSCVNIDLLGKTNPNIFGVLSIIVVLATTAIWPPLGATLASVFFCFCLIMSGNYIIAGVLLLISILWCVYSFTLKVSNTNSVLSFSLLGSFSFAQFAPFISGMFCDIKDSLINTAYGFVICFMLACLGSDVVSSWDPLKFGIIDTGMSSYGFLQKEALNLVFIPSTWINLVSWLLVSAIISISMKFSQRYIRVLACLAAVIVMVLGLCFSVYFINDCTTWQPDGFNLLLVLAAGALCTIISIFMPKRSYS